MRISLFQRDSRQRGQPKVFVVSIPKAGTYFLSEILKHSGIRQTYLHISPNKYSDYSSSPGLEEMRSEYQKFTENAPLRKSIKMIKPGEFAVGHMPYEYHDYFRDFSTIFIKRNIKDAIVSYMNFSEFSQRTTKADAVWAEEPDPQQKLLKYLTARGEYLFTSYKNLVDWEDAEDVFKVKFEELKSAETGPLRVRELAGFLKIEPAVAPEQIWQASVSAETLTKSPQGYAKQHFWSDEALQRFADFGGVEINRRLGYSS